MTNRTAVAESVAKKLCFAGEESGVGFVDSRKKNTRKHVKKHVALSATFPLWNKGEYVKHVKSVIEISRLKYM